VNLPSVNIGGAGPGFGLTLEVRARVKFRVNPNPNYQPGEGLPFNKHLNTVSANIGRRIYLGLTLSSG